MKYLTNSLQTKHKQFQMGQAANDTCTTCNVPETQDHVILECTNCKSERHKVFKELKIDNPNQIHEIFNKRQNIQKLQNFLPTIFTNETNE